MKYNVIIRGHGDEGDMDPTSDCKFFYGSRNEDHELGTGFFFLYKGVTSVVKTVKFFSYKMPYIIPRGCWCSIVLNMDAPTEDKTNNTKNSLYEELRACVQSVP